MSPGVTPGDAASSGRSADAVATDATAPVAADEDTRPHAVEVAGGYGEPATYGEPAAYSQAAGDESRVGLSKSDRSNGWSDSNRQETVSMDPAAAGNPYYANSSAYGTVGPGAANPYAPGLSRSAPPPAAVATAAPRTAARRARLKIAHLGPLSVFRISLTFALCMFIVLLVAVAALWAVLDTSGVFKSIEDAANTLVDKNRSSVADWLGFGRVMLITVVVGAANVIAFTLLSTIGALLYNLCSDFVGGVEVTLVER